MSSFQLFNGLISSYYRQSSRIGWWTWKYLFAANTDYGSCWIMLIELAARSCHFLRILILLVIRLQRLVEILYFIFSVFVSLIDNFYISVIFIGEGRKQNLIANTTLLFVNHILYLTFCSGKRWCLKNLTHSIRTLTITLIPTSTIRLIRNLFTIPL